MRCDQSRLFDHLMSEGKVSMAIRLLAEESKGGVLPLDSQVPCGALIHWVIRFNELQVIFYLRKIPVGNPLPLLSF